MNVLSKLQNVFLTYEFFEQRVFLIFLCLFVVFFFFAHVLRNLGIPPNSPLS